MILIQYSFFIFLGFAFFIIGFFAWEELKYRHRQKCRAVIDQIYAQFWSGKACDQLTTWDRVIDYLEHCSDDKELLRVAHWCKQAHEQLLSDVMSVDGKGKLVDFKG